MDWRPTGQPPSAADRLAARLVEGFPVAARLDRDRRRLDVADRRRRRAHLSSCCTDTVGSPSRFGEVIAGLVDGYRIIAPDLPGLGRSELRGGQLGPSGTTEWLDRLIAVTCTAPPILVGFSAGAGVAVRYALSGAGQIVRVVLVSPGWVGSLRMSLSLRAALVRFGRNPSRASADRVARHLLFDVDQTRTQHREPVHGDRGLPHRTGPPTGMQGRQSCPAAGDRLRRAAPDQGARGRDLRPPRPGHAGQPHATGERRARLAARP